MTLGELQSWLDDLARLQGKKPADRSPHIKSRRAGKKKGKR